MAITRRNFIKAAALGALGAALPSCSDKLLNFLGDEREQLWGLNVHPYSGSLINLQLQALEELGIKRVRITLGLGRDLAGPYIGAYPAEYIGLVSDFDRSRFNASNWPGLVRQAVDRAGGVRFFEILNEPDLFLNIRPEVYVQSFLRPAYDIIKERRPEVPVVAAAPVGTSEGRVYFFQMTEAGADSYCDYRAAHLYNNNPEIYLAGTDRPFLVTECGSSNRGSHVSWWSDNMPHISKILATDHLYFYVLLDRPETGFSLISEHAGPGGSVQPVSPLYEHIKTFRG